MSTTSSAATSASLALSGLASGIDWTSIVNELVTVERAPETQMNSQITTDNAKNAAYKAIGTQLSTLQTDLANLSNPSYFDNRATTSSSPSFATATAAAATPLGTYTFNIKKLASGAVMQGTTGTPNHLSVTNDVSGLTLSSAGFATPITAGTFTVNGQAVTIATSDTLQSVFDKISTATGGAVTGSYDATTDEISLNSSSAITLGTATDSSNFLQAAQLYNNSTGTITSAAALGGINLAVNIASANYATPVTGDSTGAGQFLINGVAINYNTSTDGTTDILNRINSSAAGVTATYDSVNGRFNLSSKTTGDVGISMQNVTGNFLTATGLLGGTLQRGTNLQYTVNNGGLLTSQSNVISGSSSGIAGLSVTALGLGATDITVSSDNSKISSAISSFVTDYNAIQNTISTDTKPTTDSSGNTVPGTLTGDQDIENIATKLRQLVGALPSGLTGSVKGVNDIGITTNGTDNTLTLDSTALSNMLATNLDGIKQLFTNANGIGTALNTYVTNTNGTNGVLATIEGNMSKEVTTITASIASLESRISNDKTRLTNEFVAMETAINSINTQKQYLNNTFGSSSASSQSAPVAAGSSSTG